jgi:hypothetical protein
VAAGLVQGVAGSVVNSLLGGTTGNSDPSNPANNLAGALARADPLLSYQWYCMMPNLSFPGTKGYTLPWYYIEEANTPLRSFEVRTIFREGRDKHYPSKYSVDALQLSFYADSANVSFNYLNAWTTGGNIAPFTSSTAAKQGGRFRVPKDNKKTIKVYFVDATKQELFLLEYTECWPQTIASYSLDGASNRLVHHVTFSVGDVFPQVYDLSSNQSLSSSILGAIASGAATAIQGALSTVGNFVSSAAGSSSALSSATSPISATIDNGSSFASIA